MKGHRVDNEDRMAKYSLRTGESTTDDTELNHQYFIYSRLNGSSLAALAHRKHQSDHISDSRVGEAGLFQGKEKKLRKRLNA